MACAHDRWLLLTLQPEMLMRCKRQNAGASVLYSMLLASCARMKCAAHASQLCCGCCDAGAHSNGTRIRSFSHSNHSFFHKNTCEIIWNNHQCIYEHQPVLSQLNKQHGKYEGTGITLNPIENMIRMFSPIWSNTSMIYQHFWTILVGRCLLNGKKVYTKSLPLISVWF